MTNMKFNPYGFIAPKTKQDYIALLDEAIRMSDELASMWNEALAVAQKSSNCPA